MVEKFVENFSNLCSLSVKKKIKNEKKRLRNYGVAEKAHGNVMNSNHAVETSVRLNALKFLQNFSEQNALVLPGRLPTYRLSTDLRLLPCSMTKAYVYNEYCKACKEADIEAVGRTLWYSLWIAHFPNVVIQRPKSDLCAVCQKEWATYSRKKRYTRKPVE